jgi:hypothetical protein
MGGIAKGWLGGGEVRTRLVHGSWTLLHVLAKSVACGWAHIRTEHLIPYPFARRPNGVYRPLHYGSLSFAYYQSYGTDMYKFAGTQRTGSQCDHVNGAKRMSG